MFRAPRSTRRAHVCRLRGARRPRRSPRGRRRRSSTQGADVVLHLGDAPAARRVTCSRPAFDVVQRSASCGRLRPYRAAICCRSSAAATLRGTHPGPKRCREQGRHHTPLVGLGSPVVGRELDVRARACRTAGRRRARRRPRTRCPAPRSTAGSRAPCAGRTCSSRTATTSTRRVFMQAAISSRVKFETPTKRALPSRTTIVEGAHGLLERRRHGRASARDTRRRGRYRGSAGSCRSTTADALGAAVAEVGPVGVPDAELGDDDRFVAAGARAPARAPAPRRRSRTPRRCRSS